MLRAATVVSGRFLSRITGGRYGRSLCADFYDQRDSGRRHDSRLIDEWFCIAINRRVVDSEHGHVPGVIWYSGISFASGSGRLGKGRECWEVVLLHQLS